MDKYEIKEMIITCLLSLVKMIITIAEMVTDHNPKRSLLFFLKQLQEQRTHVTLKWKKNFSRTTIPLRSSMALICYYLRFLLDYRGRLIDHTFTWKYYFTYQLNSHSYQISRVLMCFILKIHSTQYHTIGLNKLSFWCHCAWHTHSLRSLWL